MAGRLELFLTEEEGSRIFSLMDIDGDEKVRIMIFDYLILLFIMSYCVLYVYIHLYSFCRMIVIVHLRRLHSFFTLTFIVLYSVIRSFFHRVYSIFIFL